MELPFPKKLRLSALEIPSWLADAMHTPISSVDVNMEMIGYRGAKLLDDLMNRRAAPQQSLRVSPFRLVVRKSSDLVAVNHPGVARSLRFMWDHCHELIGVNDLARRPPCPCGIFIRLSWIIWGARRETNFTASASSAQKNCFRIPAKKWTRSPKCAVMKAAIVFGSPSNARLAYPPRNIKNNLAKPDALHFSFVAGISIVLCRNSVRFFRQFGYLDSDL